MDHQEDFFRESTVAFCRTEVGTGKFVLANQALANILGCTLEDLKENYLSSDLYPQEVRQDLIRELNEKGVADQTLELHIPNGKHLWIMGHFRLDGDFIDCVLSDISVMSELQDKQQKMSEEIDSRLKSYDKV